MIRFLLKNPVFKYCLFGIIVLNIAQVLILFFGIKIYEGQVFLHYTTYLGVDLIGVWYMIYFIPISSVVLNVVNIALSAYLGEKDILMGYLFILSSTLISLVLLAHSILIVLLNS